MRLLKLWLFFQVAAPFMIAFVVIYTDDIDALCRAHHLLLGWVLVIGSIVGLLRMRRYLIETGQV